MKNLKPYLIRAINEWINDNDLTPHLMVDAEVPGTIVPTDYIEKGKIILNLRPSAINNLTIANDHLEFLSLGFMPKKMAKECSLIRQKIMTKNRQNSQKK